MLNQRVVKDEEIGKAAVLFHGIRAVAAALSVDSGESGNSFGAEAAQVLHGWAQAMTPVYPN
jgi:hypothetical protein